MRGILYGIGVGPGDPELLTLKAAKVLQGVDVVIAPRTQKKEKSTALSIAAPHLKEDIEILELIFPMVYDDNQLNEAWTKNVEVILALLDQGKQVAFLTLGDPMLYSTYMYIYRLLTKYKINIQTIPGVTSFCAAGSRLGFPLAEGNDILTIIPATCDREKLTRALAISDNVVLMKVYKNTDQVLEQLQAKDLAEHAVMVSKCGLPDETIYYNINDACGLKPTYLSTILARKRPTGM